MAAHAPCWARASARGRRHRLCRAPGPDRRQRDRRHAAPRRLGLPGGVRAVRDAYRRSSICIVAQPPDRPAALRRRAARAPVGRGGGGADLQRTVPRGAGEGLAAHALRVLDPRRLCRRRTRTLAVS